MNVSTVHDTRQPGCTMVVVILTLTLSLGSSDLLTAEMLRYKIGVMNLPSCCARADILHQLKIAFRELAMTEEFHLEGDAYYATLGATQASELVSGKHCPPLAKGTNFSTCR